MEEVDVLACVLKLFVRDGLEYAFFRPAKHDKYEGVADTHVSKAVGQHALQRHAVQAGERGPLYLSDALAVLLTE